MDLPGNKYFFKEDNLHIAREIVVHHPLGLAIDIDGTISEIVATPGEATVTEGSRRWLARLVEQLGLVVAVSGRPVAEARAMVGIEEMLYLGNHGLELWENGRIKIRTDAEEYVRQVSASLAEIRQQLSIKDVLLENKGVTAAIHYRNAAQPDAARKEIIQAIKKSPSAAGLRITQGKMVVELRPPIKADKGIAVKELTQEHHLGGMFYAGDDFTDIDAFAALRELRKAKAISALSVAVLGTETPPEVIANADLVLCSVEEMEKFLMWLSQEVGAPS